MPDRANGDVDWTSEIRAHLAPGGPSLDDDVVEELAQHAAATYAAARADGLPSDDAAAGVRHLIVSWGRNAAALQRVHHRQRAVEPPAGRAWYFGGLAQDARYAVRLIRRAPGYAVVAVLIMALGIGAVTTLFSIAYGVLLKPLPWPDAGRLVRITETRKGQAARIRGTITNGSYLAWSDPPPSTVESIGGYSTNDVTAAAAGSADPVRVRLSRVTPTLFPLLGVKAERGRLFTPDEGTTGSRGGYQVPTVALLSFGLWQQWFGGHDDVLNRRLTIDGMPVTIIGVMPRGFAFPDTETRVWVPMPIGAVLGEQGVRRIQIFPALARLRPGATPAQAAAEGTARARSAPDPGLAAVAMFGSSAPPDITATPAIEAMTVEVRPAILVLLAAVALLLATATANVGSLHLARATSRRREIAIRAAIGADGGRLTRQLVVESSIVGIAGGLAGVLVAAGLHRALPAVLPADFPRASDIALDLRVLAFAIALTFATGLVCGLLPAVEARRVQLTEALADDGAASVTGGRRSRTGRLRTAIMIAQMAVACVLLVGAALLARSFLALMHADRGYDPTNVLTARVDLPASYDNSRRAAFADAVLQRIQEFPGVSHAGVGNALPLLSLGGNYGFAMPSPRDPAIRMQVQTILRSVSPGYFAALRLRLLEGRTLSDADTLASRPVLVVNRSFARRYLGDRPVGTRVPLSFGEGRPDGDIVGVVDDMRQGDVTDAQMPEVFTSYRQMSSRLANASLILVIRSSDDPGRLVPMLRSAVREQDRTVAIDSVMTMEERLLTSLARPRTYAVLLAAFAICALTIAGVGLFGVLSYGVAQRAREIGVRTALGARVRHIVGLVLAQAAFVVAAGVAIGLGAALGLVRFVGSILYGVTAHDPVSFVVVPVVLALVAAIACVVPARRAAAIDPLKVLRG